MNKKGVMGKIISGLPVFLTIFMLISSFIVFSIVIKKTFGGFGEAVSLTDNDLLFQVVPIKFDGVYRQMSVAQAIFVINDKAISTKIHPVDGLFAALGMLLAEKGRVGDCLFVDSGEIESGKTLKNEGYTFGVAYRGVGYKKYATGTTFSTPPSMSAKPNNLNEINSKAVNLENLEDPAKYSGNVAVGRFGFINIDGKEIIVKSYFGRCI